MAGVGKYKKGVKFTLKSGNKPSFFQMGSSPAKQKQKHEGAETMAASTLRDKWGVEGLESSGDYYVKRGEQGEPMVLGEVGLEKGEVEGVPGSEGGKLTRKGD